MATAEDDDYEYDGYLLYNELCFSESVADQELTKVPASAEAHLLEEYLPRFESGNSNNEGDGFESSDIRNHTHKLPDETAEFIDSLISLRYRTEEYEPVEAEVEPDEPRQEVKIPQETSADIFWSAPDYVYVRGADGPAGDAREELNKYLGQSASIHDRVLKSPFLLWLFEKIYYDEELTTSLELDRLTDAKVEGAEDILGKENTVRESANAKQAPVLLIGLLLGKKLTKMEGDFVLSTGDEDDDEITVRVEVAKGKVQIKSSKSGFGNKNSVEKIAYSTQITHEIMGLFADWRKLDEEDQAVSPKFLGDLLIDAHENDIDLKDKNSILQVFQRYANLRDDELGDYDIEEALELLEEDEEDESEDDES